MQLGHPAERSLEVAAAEEMQVLIDEAGDDLLPGGIDDLAPPRAAVLSAKPSPMARMRGPEIRISFRPSASGAKIVATADHREECGSVIVATLTDRLQIELGAHPCGEDLAIDGSIDRLVGRGKLLGPRSGVPGAAALAGIAGFPGRMCG